MMHLLLSNKSKKRRQPSGKLEFPIFKDGNTHEMIHAENMCLLYTFLFVFFFGYPNSLVNEFSFSLSKNKRAGQ